MSLLVVCQRLSSFYCKLASHYLELFNNDMIRQGTLVEQYSMRCLYSHQFETIKAVATVVLDEVEKMRFDFDVARVDEAMALAEAQHDRELAQLIKKEQG